jgi:hypothetical protein
MTVQPRRGSRPGDTLVSVAKQGGSNSGTPWFSGIDFDALLDRVVALGGSRRQHESFSSQI